MSDFDDDETTAEEGAEAPATGAGAPPAADDDWDDAPAPRRRRPVDDDDWDDDDWDDDWDDEGSGAPKRDLTIVYAVVAAAIVIVLAVVLTRPKDDNGSSASNDGKQGGSTAPAEIVKNWQGPVGDAVGANGADAQKRAKANEGVTIWTDFQGWHVRSNRTDDVVVTVTAPQVRQKATDDYDDKDEKADAPFKATVVVTVPAGPGSTSARRAI